MPPDIPAFIEFRGGPLDGHKVEWPGSLDALPGWLGGGTHFDPTKVPPHIYIQVLALDLKLMDGIVVYEYAPRLSNNLIRFSETKET